MDKNIKDEAARIKYARNTVMAIVELFDDLERKHYGVPEDSWRAYKFIRNNIRDWAKSKGFLSKDE